MAATTPRTVLITGAAGGIGRAMVAAVLAAGHRVAALDRDAAALDALVALHPGAPLHPIPADLASAEGCRAGVAAAAARFGSVHAVVNNAGIGVSSLRPDAETRLPSIEELDAAAWDRFFAVNLRAPALLLREALPMMRAAGWGRVVNNTTSFRTMLRVLPYGATKAALEAASAVWAAELAGAGITVNVLVPGGPTDTPFIGAGASWPRGQMLRPEIMGPPLAWLLSDEAADYTGQRIIAARWDASLPGTEAAAMSGRAIGWPELAADAVWLQG
ncbi:SDR family NAD(P)-dependent oxidoreductase [Neoroseomonas soli]|uniref:SDR family oxidoreductase n=1 Tax=Neoroseomonas soli TaxID=1081025 RepID=A0A9X9X3X4_9PROT|nr:SDR family oxidoreductase [Neoroseomonas soli]MBR0674103.1 SDR family oxidoreductase [Neoroseomonas soli]